MSYRGILTKYTAICHLHADRKEPIIFSSVTGSKYFVTIVHEYSSFVYTFSNKSKDNISKFFLQYVSGFEPQSGSSILSIHSENVTEFLRAHSELKER